MLTITTRELKQNPAAAIRDVLAQDTPAVVTAHGAPTGVLLVPETSRRHQWVSGRILVDAVTPLGADEARAWRDDLAAGRDTPLGRDLWGDQA